MTMEERHELYVKTKYLLCGRSDNLIFSQKLAGISTSFDTTTPAGQMLTEAFQKMDAFYKTQPEYVDHMAMAADALATQPAPVLTSKPLCEALNRAMRKPATLCIGLLTLDTYKG